MPTSTRKKTAHRRRGFGELGTDPMGHGAAADKIMRKFYERPAPTTCKGAIVALTMAVRARDAADASGDPNLIRLANSLQPITKKGVVRRCRETNYMPVAFHLDGLGTLPPPIPAAARRKCVAWRYVGTSRRCAIFENDTGFRTAKAPIVPPARPLIFGPLDGLEESILRPQVLWAAAGLTALALWSIARSINGPSASSPVTPPVLTAAQQAVLDDLNRARATQGLAPLPA